MKTHYIKITEEYIFRLLRMHRNLLLEDLQETLEGFDNIEEMKKYEATYNRYCRLQDKIQKLEIILLNEENTDIIIQKKLP